MADAALPGLTAPSVHATARVAVMRSRPVRGSISFIRSVQCILPGVNQRLLKAKPPRKCAERHSMIDEQFPIGIQDIAGRIGKVFFFLAMSAVFPTPAIASGTEV